MRRHLHNGRPEFAHGAACPARACYSPQNALAPWHLRLGNLLSCRPTHEPEQEHAT
jgi:hypothetical protein